MTLLVDDGDYEAEDDETDSNESKDERRSVSRVERTIVISPIVVCRPDGWGRCG